MFKICAIGCGYIANDAHGPAYRKYASLYPDTELTACCDINEQKAESFSRKFGFIRYYTDVDTMLDKEKPDAVCLAVPASMAAELSIKVIKKRHPLILEKPPGINREEVLKIIGAAEKYNTKTRVAFNRRYTPLVNDLKERLSSLQPLEIHNLQYNLYRTGRRDSDFSLTAIHGIDILRYITDADYKHIRFNYQSLPLMGENVVNIFMDCSMDSGATTQLSFCPVTGVVIERAVVNLHDNSFFVDLPVWNGQDTPGKLVHVQKGIVVVQMSGSDLTDSNEMFELNGFYCENASFFDDLKSGKAFDNSLGASLQSVEVADCIRKRMPEYNKK